MDRTQYQRGKPIKISVDGTQCKLTTFTEAEVATNPSREARDKMWEKEDMDTLGRKLIINGIDVRPSPKWIEGRLNQYGINITDVPRVMLSNRPDERDGTPLYRTIFTVVDDRTTAWMTSQGAECIKMGGRKIWIKIANPRKGRSEAKALQAEERRF